MKAVKIMGVLTLAAIAGLVAALIYQVQEAAALRRELAQYSSVMGELRLLRCDVADLERYKQEAAQLREENLELQQLRAEVTKLRAAASLVTPPVEQPKEVEKDREVKPAQTVTIETTVLELPYSALSRGPSGRIPPGVLRLTPEAEEPWVVTGSEAAGLLDELKRLDGITALAAPRVTTLMGREAQIELVEQSGETINQHSQPAGVPYGITTRVNPRLAEDGSTLLVSLQLFLPAGESPPVRSSGESRLRVREEKADLAIPANEIALLARRIAAPDGPDKLQVIVVTPQLHAAP